MKMVKRFACVSQAYAPNFWFYIPGDYIKCSDYPRKLGYLGGTARKMNTRARSVSTAVRLKIDIVDTAKRRRDSWTLCG